MKRYEKITKFIPALDNVIPADWSFESRAIIENTEMPTAEYWDVVYRLMDAVFDAPDPENENAEAVLSGLRRAFEAEEETPGLLYGMFANGTITDMLKKLRAEDGE